MLAVSGTVLFWGSAFVAIRAALRDYDSGQLVSLRFMVSSVILIVVAVLRRSTLPRLQDLPSICLCGFIGISVYQLALSMGQKSVTAGAACLIINTAPIYTILLANLFLKEQLRKGIWFGTAISLTGTTLIALGESGGITFNRGAILIVIAALCHAGYFVIQKPLLKKYAPAELASYMIWAGSLFLFPFFPGAVIKTETAGIAAIGAILFLSIFSTVIGFFCWSYVLSTRPASHAVSFLYMTPVVAVLLEWIIFHELPRFPTAFGGLLSLGGVIVVNSPRRS